jgi:hypothetical protein
VLRSLTSLTFAAVAAAMLEACGGGEDGADEERAQNYALQVEPVRIRRPLEGPAERRGRRCRGLAVVGPPGGVQEMDSRAAAATLSET